MKYAAWIAVLAGTVVAQNAPTQSEIRGQKIIADAIEALGGPEFLGMQDRIETGRAYSYYRDQISGLSIAKIYTRYTSLPPGKSSQRIGQQERQAFGKDEDSAVLFTDTGGWDLSWRGAKELDKDRIARWRDTTLRNIFYILRVRLHEPGMIFEAQAPDIFDNQPVNIVNITDADDRVITVYFNQDTKLPVRQIYSHYNDQTKERDDEVTLYSRYRDAGNGVQWPHQIRRERNGDKVYEIFSDSVQINQDLTDNLFTVPPPGESAVQKPRRKK